MNDVLSGDYEYLVVNKDTGSHNRFKSRSDVDSYVNEFLSENINTLYVYELCKIANMKDLIEKYISSVDGFVSKKMIADKFGIKNSSIKYYFKKYNLSQKLIDHNASIDGVKNVTQKAIDIKNYIEKQKSPLTYKGIGEHFGVSKQAAYSFMKFHSLIDCFEKHNAEFNKGKIKVYFDMQIEFEKFIKSSTEYLTHEAIGKKFGLQKITVRRCILKYNLKDLLKSHNNEFKKSMDRADEIKNFILNSNEILTYKSIANHFGVAITTIIYYFKNYGFHKIHAEHNKKIRDMKIGK